MTPLTYAPKDASPRSAPVRFLFRHNPFYLLSAMCMLAGCLALTNSLSWTSIPLPRLLALIATLNLYEGLLLALGWKARWAAVALFLFLIPTTLIFHQYWGIEPKLAQVQKIHFLKNVAIMGGMLMVLAIGAGAWSVDRK